MGLKNCISCFGFWGGLKAWEGYSRRTINPNMPPGPGDEMLSLWGEIAERIEYFQITMRYRHKVEAYTIHREADDWCKENCHGKWYYHHQPWLDDGPYYRFKDETDVMAFKLRWS